MAQPADLQRLLGDLAREGVIVSVDRSAGTARVEFAEGLTTGNIPWLSPRAGKTRIWSPPSVGECVLVLAPEADATRGIIVGSLIATSVVGEMAKDAAGATNYTTLFSIPMWASVACLALLMLFYPSKSSKGA